MDWKFPNGPKEEGENESNGDRVFTKNSESIGGRIFTKNSNLDSAYLWHHRQRQNELRGGHGTILQLTYDTLIINGLSTLFLPC